MIRRLVKQKRVLSFVLALVMVLGVLPSFAPKAHAELLSGSIDGVDYDWNTEPQKVSKIYANGKPIVVESSGVYIDANRNGKVDSGETRVCDTKENLYIYGGSKDSDLTADTMITINSGTLSRVYAGNCDGGTLTGKGRIVINGGKVTDEIVSIYKGTTKGNVSIEINGGSLDSINCVGINDLGKLEGNVNVKMTGGEISDTLCITTNGRITGDIKIDVTGGSINKLRLYSYTEDVDGDIDFVLVDGSLGMLDNRVFTATQEYRAKGIVSVIVLGSDVDEIFKPDEFIDNLLVRKKNSDWTVKGAVSVPEGATLTIPEGYGLTIPAGASLSNYGTIVNYGSFVNKGRYDGNGRNECYSHTYAYLSDGRWACMLCGWLCEHEERNSATCLNPESCKFCGWRGGSVLDHSYAYSAEDNKVTEMCISGCTHSETAELKLKDNADLTYTGSAITPFEMVYPAGWIGAKKQPSASDYRNNINVGEASIAYSYADGAKVTGSFKIQPADISGATIVLTPAEDVYSGEDCAPSVSVTYPQIGELTAGEDYTLGWYDENGISVNSVESVGNYNVIISGKNNFEGSIRAPFVVGKADLTGVAVAQQGSLVYNGGAALTPEVSVTAVSMGGQEVKFTYAMAQNGTYGAMPSFTEAGEYTVYYKASAPEHNDSYGSFTVTVAKAEPAFTVPSGLTAVYGSTLESVELGTGWQWKDETLNVGVVGTHKFVAVFTPEDTANYNIVEAEVSVTVEKAQLTVKADDATIIYGEEPKDGGVTFVGFVNGDTAENLEGTLEFTFNYDQFGNAGSYSITPNGLDSANYEIIFVDGELTVEPKEIEISWGATEFMPYTGSKILPKAYVYGLLNEDTCEITVDVVETTEGAGIIPGRWTVRTIALSNSNYKFPASGELMEVTYGIVNGYQAPPVLEGNAETIFAKADGTITGLTTEMEYSTEYTGDDDKFTRVTDADMTFAPGTYYVRYCAKQYYNASVFATVEIGEGRMLTVSVEDEQTGYTLEADKDEFEYNGEFTLRLTVAEGYSKTADFAVMLNGEDIGFGDNTQVTLQGIQEDAVITVRGIADTTEPTAEIKTKDNSWTEFLIEASADLFYKDALEVVISGDDAISGVESVKYYISSEWLTIDEVKQISEWKEYTDAFKLDTDGEFIVYAKVTDNSGNIVYVNSAKIVIDATAPVLEGIEDGKTYYTTRKVTVTDSNKVTVTVNGSVVELQDGVFTLEGNKDEVYAVVATDASGNETKVSVTMKPVSALSEPINGMTEESVNSDDEQAVSGVTEALEDVDVTDATEAEKAALKEIAEKAEGLLGAIEEAAQAADTENTEKIEDVTSDNVEIDDKADLEKAKEDLEKALEEKNGNYTEEEKKQIEDEIKRIEESLNVIENAEAVESVIAELPESVDPDDGDTLAEIATAKAAFDGLSDYEKSLVPAETKVKLDKLLADSLAYAIIKGDGSVWEKGSEGTVSFTFNGLFVKFVGVKVDGTLVDASNYDAKSGSTIITFNKDYLDTISEGKHTVTAVYTDGEAEGSFEILPEAKTPSTGSNNDLALYGALAAFNLTALAVVVFLLKKEKRAR